MSGNDSFTFNQEDVSQQSQTIERLRNLLGPAALYDQLAEECVELAQAALKQSRYIRGVNPTSMEQVDIVTSINEEVSDVLLCLDVLGLQPDVRLIYAKLNRWDSRVQKRVKELQKELEKEPLETKEDDEHGSE